MGSGVRPSPEEIERIAHLAGLAPDPESLSTLTEQIGAILDFVGQLDMPTSENEHLTYHPPSAGAPLRTDEVRPRSMTLPPEQMAPEFAEDLYVVPRVTGLGDAGE